MPFEYEVDTHTRIARVVGRGIVEVADTLEAARNAARDAKAGVAPLLPTKSASGFSSRRARPR